MPIKFIHEIKEALKQAEEQKALEKIALSEKVSFRKIITEPEKKPYLSQANQVKVPIIEFDPSCVSQKVKLMIADYIREKGKKVNINSFEPEDIFKQVSRPGEMYRQILEEHSRTSKYNHSLLPLNWRLRSDKSIDNLFNLCKEKCGLLDDSIPDDKKLDIEEYIAKTWIFHARKTQVPPKGNWTYYVYLAGRGVGKTTAAGQWLISMALAYPGCRIAIVTNTPDEGWKYIIEQTLKTILPSWIELKYNKNDKTVTFPNGSMCILHSAHNPEKLRGSRHHFAICDELCKWKDAEDVFRQLKMTCTLSGKKWGIDDLSNRYFISTTPIPSKMLTGILSNSRTVVMRETTFDNAEFIPSSSLYDLIEENCGTAFGRQELLGEIVDMSGFSIFNINDVEGRRVKDFDYTRHLEKVVIGVDPQARKANDDDPNMSETGIVICGVDSESHYYVLGDMSINGLPSEWVKQVQEAYRAFNADAVVVEKNHGRDMVVEAFQANLEQDIPIVYVEAKKGKATRAGPVALLYEQGRVHHMGFHDTLERQMFSWSGDPKERSPDRVDALVWAIHELMKNSGYKGFI